MALIIDHNTQFNNCRIQNDTKTDTIDNTASSDKNSLKINIPYLESNNITNNIFSMITSDKINNHIASDELREIFDANLIHYKEARPFTSDDSDQSKD